MPICVLIAALAAPGLHLLYGQKWSDAIPVVQVIGIGMCFNISFALSINLMMAQARYKELFWFNFYRAAGFILLVGVGAKFAGAIGAGFATAVFLLVYGPWITYIAIRPNGGTIGDVVSVHALPLLVALLSCAIPEALAQAIQSIGAVPARHIIFVSALSAAGALILGRWFMPVAWAELVSRFKTSIAK
jgi:PST family polysaccharide transporter